MPVEAPGFRVMRFVDNVTAGVLPEISIVSAVRLSGATNPSGAPRVVLHNVKVSAVEPTLVMVRVLDSCTSPVPIPKEIDVGASADVACSAASMLRFPAPASCTRAATPDFNEMGLAELMINERYSATLRPGRADLSKAAAPATIGDEK